MDEAWAVVVDYGQRTAPELVQALGEGGAARVLVVENAGQASRRAELSQGSWVLEELSFGANVGFGGAINRVLSRHGAEWLLVVNPDVVLEPVVVRAMVDLGASDPTIGAVAPHLLDEAGGLAPSVRRFPSFGVAAVHGALGLVWPANPATRRYHLVGGRPSRPYEAPWVSGACVAFRWRALESVAGFDAAYFLYLEDVDVAWRLWRSGWRVVVEPHSHVTHHGGGTTRSHPVRAALWHARSLIRYGLAQESSTLSAATILAGVSARALVAAFRGATRYRRESLT